MSFWAQKFPGVARPGRGDKARSAAEMQALDALDEYLVTGWDPTRGP